MKFDLSAAGIGALIGGGLIWILEEYVFAGGTPGILRDFIDWLAPVLGGILFGLIYPRIPGLPHPYADHHPEPGRQPASDGP